MKIDILNIIKDFLLDNMIRVVDDNKIEITFDLYDILEESILYGVVCCESEFIETARTENDRVGYSKYFMHIKDEQLLCYLSGHPPTEKVYSFILQIFYSFKEREFKEISDYESSYKHECLGIGNHYIGICPLMAAELKCPYVEEGIEYSCLECELCSDKKFTFDELLEFAGEL